MADVVARRCPPPSAVGLSCKTPGTRGKLHVMIVDQGSPEPQHFMPQREKPRTGFLTWEPGFAYGFVKFASQADLQRRPGYLADNRLLVRVRVEVLHE